MELTINGMSCGHCVGQVMKVLTGLQGVTVNRITVGSSSVSYDSATITASSILQALKEVGYDPVVSGRTV